MTNTSLDVKVRQLQPATLAYIRHIGPYKGDTALFRGSSAGFLLGPGRVD